MFCLCVCVCRSRVDDVASQRAAATLATVTFPFKASNTVTVQALGTINPGLWYPKQWHPQDELALPNVALSTCCGVFGLLAVVNYYNDKYIWPVGFRSTRQYNSYLVLDGRVDYVSEILDGGPVGPVFKVRPRVLQRFGWFVE